MKLRPPAAGAGIGGPTPREALNAALRQNFVAFVQKVFLTLNPRETLQLGWYVEAMCAAAVTIFHGSETRLIINVPPRSLKTIVFSVALTAFILGHKPSAKLICVSYNQDLANTFSRRTREVMEQPWFKQIFPATVLAKITEDLLETTAGGARIATSPGGTVTGLGADYIILDDPIKPEEAASQTARDRAFRFYQQTLLSRLNDKATGRVLWVMQRLHEDDPVGRLLKAGGWAHLCLPAIAFRDEAIPNGFGTTHYRKAGDVLHPEREPLEVLEGLRRDLGGPTFAAQYQQAPVPAEGLYVQAEWLSRYRTPPDKSTLRTVQSWDTAMSGDRKADFSVCTTWGEREGRHYLLDVCRVQLDQPQLINKAEELYRKYAPHALLIEKHGSGIGMIQALRASYGIYAIPITQTLDKQTRLINVTPMFESGQVLLPTDEPWLVTFEAELLGFPNTRYDDQVDSISQYLTWARDRSGDGVFSCTWI